MNKKLREKVFYKYKGFCAYCGDLIYKNNFHIDHFVSKKLGGNNDFKNLMPSCKPCNFRKNVLDIEEFRSEIVKQIIRLRRDSSAFRLIERYKMIEIKTLDVVFHFEKIKD